MNKNLFTEREAATYLSLSNPSTLSQWRFHKRYELPFVKIGSAIRYRKDDLDKYIEDNLHNGGCDEMTAIITRKCVVL